MSETRTATSDDRIHQAAATGAEVGKHRGPASREDAETAPHGKHRRPDHER